MDKHKSDIKKIFDNIEQDDEFEIMFNNYKKNNKLLINNFINIMKYIKWRSLNEKLELKKSFELNIQYSIDTENVYRFVIEEEDNVNNFLELVHFKKKYNIISILVNQFIGKKNYSLIKKVKNKKNILDIDEYDIRIRKSKEISVSSNEKKELLNLNPSDQHNIIFRVKQRLSLVLDEDLHIDLTIIKMANEIKELNNVNKQYELEIDYSPKKVNKSILDKILKETETIKKVMNQSDNLVTNSRKLSILEKYKILMFGKNNSNITNLYSMQPINAEVPHFIDNIPNKYSVTDKADGDKYTLFITDGELYLINNNLNLKYVSSNHKLKDTVLEGEYIFLPKKKIYVLMLFDCLYFDGTDMRNEPILQKRLEMLKKSLDIINPNNNYYYIKSYDGKFDMKLTKNHYQKEIENYFKNLNSNIDKSNNLLLYPKMFIFPQGVSKSEVYLFSILIWNNCTKNAKVNCPYILDGIIYTGLDQKYSRDRKQHKLPIYKFKPPTTNSLDVYIRFQKNKETNTYMDIFDNSLPDSVKDVNYRVTNLFVGETSGGKEVPVPFMPEENNDQALLQIVDGNVRDIHGELVQDNTVIEIRYNIDSNLPHQYKWSVLKTRWDKTESVLRDNKKYGNYNDTAIKVWRSIKESVTMEEVKNLSIEQNYNTQIKILASRIDSSVISSSKKQDAYYQKVTNLLKIFRQFNNWIKSILIYTYCGETKRNFKDKPKRQSVLDMGSGRGGDLMKIYHARVGEYVGFDPNYEGIYSSTNGAISRYNYLKKKFPGFGKLTFVQADGSALLNPEEQEKKLTNLSQENKKMIQKIFDGKRKFDIIMSQFAIHYLFGDSTSVKNLITNIKTYLRKDGYLIYTLLDGDLVHKRLEEGKYTSIYTNEDGKRVKLFEIVKKYTGELQNKTGQAVDIHMSWISNEDTYNEEYLVSKELMIKTMELAGCRLVDTDLFKNIYYLNKDYFNNVIQFEENPKNKKMFENVKDFFGDLKGVDKESKDYAFLHRYYIFQKIE